MLNKKYARLVRTSPATHAMAEPTPNIAANNSVIAYTFACLTPAWIRLYQEGASR